MHALDRCAQADLLCGAVVTRCAHACAENLPDLLDTRATIRTRLAPASNLRQGAMTLANLLMELAIRDAFADADEHGE